MGRPSSHGAQRTHTPLAAPATPARLALSGVSLALLHFQPRGSLLAPEGTQSFSSWALPRDGQILRARPSLSAGVQSPTWLPIRSCLVLGSLEPTRLWEGEHGCMKGLQSAGRHHMCEVHVAVCVHVRTGPGQGRRNFRSPGVESSMQITGRHTGGPRAHPSGDSLACSLLVRGRPAPTAAGLSHERLHRQVGGGGVDWPGSQFRWSPSFPGLTQLMACGARTAH